MSTVCKTFGMFIDHVLYYKYDIQHVKLYLNALVHIEHDDDVNHHYSINILNYLNGPDSSVVRAYGLGSGRPWVRSSPR